MSWVLSTSGAATIKAGANVSSSLKSSSANLDKMSDQAEGWVVGMSKRDWTGDYTGLPSEIKYLLDNITSSIIAMLMINYDMSGYTSLEQAQTMLDLNYDIATKGLSELKNFRTGDIKSID